MPTECTEFRPDDGTRVPTKRLADLASLETAPQGQKNERTSVKTHGAGSSPTGS